MCGSIARVGEFEEAATWWYQWWSIATKCTGNGRHAYKEVGILPGNERFHNNDGKAKNKHRQCVRKRQQAKGQRSHVTQSQVTINWNLLSVSIGQCKHWHNAVYNGMNGIPMIEHEEWKPTTRCTCGCMAWSEASIATSLDLMSSKGFDGEAISIRGGAGFGNQCHRPEAFAASSAPIRDSPKQPRNQNEA